MHICHQIKGPIIIVYLKGHAVKLKWVNYKIFSKDMIFAKNAFLKLENIHNFDTYYDPLRNIVLKLFYNKCRAKTCEIFTQSY